MNVHASVLVTLVSTLSSAPSFGQEPGDEPFGAEDYGSADNAVLIPEPLVFDLVRGLGADRGELEINVLVEQPLTLSGADEKPTAWAPEIEVAVIDGLALELEFPFEDGELIAEKFAVQGTFGVAFDNHFIHGTQFIAEHLRNESAWELTFLYIPGIRFDKTWSALMMIGFRTLVGNDDDHAGESETEALFNFSLFADVSHRMTLGVETNYAAALSGEASLLAMPQLHFEITDHFMVQAGVGVRFTDEESLPEAATRIIYSF